MQNRRLRSNIRIVLPVFMFFLMAAFIFGAEEQQQGPPGFFDFWALPRIWLGAILGFFGVLLLMTKKATKWVRLIALAVIFFAFSVVSNLPFGSFGRGMGLHPSPMCTVEKPFLFLNAGKGIPLIFISIFAFMALMTFIANKSFCGWNCPIGAIQEMIHRVPLPKKLKIKLPFKAANIMRIVFFAAFILFLFTTGFSLYAFINPFEFLHWSLEWAVLPAFLITFVAALFLFRPFCYTACPVGLFTWLFEHVSIVRVKLDKSACTDCMRCVTASPCPAVPAILEGKRIRPDCHACGICIDACPEDALRFKM